jgi:hypothetical protein
MPLCKQSAPDRHEFDQSKVRDDRGNLIPEEIFALKLTNPLVESP